MKKFLALMSALLVVFAFVACSDDDSSGNGNGSNGNGTGGTAIVAFYNGDMEGDFFSTTYALVPAASGLVTTEFHAGTKSFHISGTPSGNGYCFTTLSNMKPRGTYTKLTFWMKGTATGKGFSINLGGNPAAVNKVYNGAYVFNASAGGNTAADTGEITAAKTIPVAPLEDPYSNGYLGRVNNYTGSISLPAWTKITLDLTGCTGGSEMTNFPLSFKVGKSGVYDVYLDDFKYEP